jgi:hypothetical protein
MLRSIYCAVIACVALLGGSSAVQSAEPAKRCDAKEFRAFDFWVGEWRVTWTTLQGQPAEGRSSIQRVVGGCAIEEHWQGKDGSEGKSLSFFDPGTKRWHQTWVDATAQPLMFEGNFEGESLVLTAKVAHGGGFQTYHRITWTPLPGGVRQHWQQSANGQTWDTVFDGRYAPAKDH